jgi:hypothetical protein
LSGPDRPSKPSKGQDHHIGHQTVAVVNGGERGKLNRFATAGHTQFTPQLKASSEVHRWPPTALASRKFAAREHRVIGADPTTHGDLQQQQGHDHPQTEHRARTQARGRGPRLVKHTLDTQQSQQAQAPQEVQGNDGGEEFHGHRPSTECPLHTNPKQGDPSPSRRHGQSAAVTPRQEGQGQNQTAHACGQVAVDHFNPRLGPRHRARGHGGLRGVDFSAGAQGRGAAVTSGPIRTTQTRIGQPSEGAKEHQVKRDEKGDERERAKTHRCGFMALTPDHPQQRPQGQQGTQEQQLQHG